MRAKHKDRVRQLLRRRDFLASRVAGYQGKNDSYDRAECAAIGWAIRIIEAAEREGILDDLDRVSSLVPEEVKS